MGATFAMTESVVANQRETDDVLNGVAGGCAAGFLAGIRGSLVDLQNKFLINYCYSTARSLPVAVASCAIIGGAMGVFDYAGQLSGNQSETREERRRKFFKHPPKPLVQTSTE